MNRYPVQVRANRDASPPGRWLWLVKWLLLIPHYLVLAVLWVAFVALTLIAYVVVLFTGRYPHGILAFNVGVLRWSWRVGYYGYQVLGTDRYPPFTLAECPDYPATLHVDHPPRPARWLPLVAWLFAIPHLMIVAAFSGAGTYQIYNNGNANVTVPLGLVSTGVIVAAVSLLFTGRYPRGLYDLLLGVARWSLRTIAYVALLTEAYPPFRLDQGETAPGDGPYDGPGSTGAVPPGRSAPSNPPGGPSAAQPPPAQPPTATTGPSNGAAVAGRIVALVVGVLLLIVGVGSGIGGTALLVLNGNRDASGYISSRTLDVSSPTASVTAEGIKVQAGDVWSRDLGGSGDIRITAAGPSATPLFLGIAAQSDVDRWLAGIAHDQLTGLYGNGGVRYDRAPGAVRETGSPGEQNFWLARTGGTGTVTLDWKPTNGRFAVVLANADGARGVTAGVRVATKVPDLAPLGWGLIGGGVLFAALAFVLIYLGASGLGRRHSLPSPAPAGPSGSPPMTGPPGRAPVGSTPAAG